MKSAVVRFLRWVPLAVLLASCAGPQIFHQQLSALDKGLTQVQVVERLKQPPLSVHLASVGGRSFEFHRYSLNSGVHTELYLLAYEKDALVYWGYVSEFRRQPDGALIEGVGLVLRDPAGTAKR